VVVHLRHSESLYCLAFEIELNQHGGFVTNHPPLVPWLDGDELRGLILDNAAILKPHVDLAPRHETDVCVHTQFRSHHGAQMGGKVESRRVDHALYSDVAGPGNVDLDTANLLVLVSLHGGKEWIGRTHWLLPPN
jgi:hypothetical protein